MEEVVDGDKIAIRSKDGTIVFAKCTGVTHANLIHFMYEDENGNPRAGMVGRNNVDKVDS